MQTCPATFALFSVRRNDAFHARSNKTACLCAWLISLVPFSAETGWGAPATTTFSYTGPPVPIQDGADLSGTSPGAPAFASLLVSGTTDVISNLAFRFDGLVSSAGGDTTVGLDHTFVNDLQITLISPIGTMVRLINHTDGSGNNFAQTILDDSAAVSIQSAISSQAPFNGTWSPYQPLSTFLGEPANGIWQLEVQDFFAFDTGSIRLFSLIITTGVLPAAESAPGPAGAPKKSPPILLTDAGAIYSALTTGLMMPGINRAVVHQAGFGMVNGDLNDRLLRARSGDCDKDGDIDASDFQLWQRNFGSQASSGDTLRYLDFAARQHIDYRVALGLADGEEVEIHDTLSGSGFPVSSMPFAMLGGPAPFASATAVVAVPEGSCKETIGGKAVIGENPYRRLETFTQFDYGAFDLDNLTDIARGFETDNYAGTLGMEYRLAPNLLVGGAFSHVWSDTEAVNDLGGIDLEGQMLSAYGTWMWHGCYFDALYSYGTFNNEIHRNTLLGSRTHGDTDSDSHNIALNSGYTLQLTDRITTGPDLGLVYSNGDIDSYTEKNGGAANLIYPDDNFESMIGRLGWHVTHFADTRIGRVTTQLRAGWAHEFMPEADVVSATLQTSPFLLVQGNHARRIGGFTAEADGAHPGQDWLELGAAVRLDFGGGWNSSLGYQGQFGRNNASAHLGTARLGYEW